MLANQLHWKGGSICWWIGDGYAAHQPLALDDFLTLADPTFTPTELLEISSVIRPAAVAPAEDAGAEAGSAPPDAVEQRALPTPSRSIFQNFGYI